MSIDIRRHGKYQVYETTQRYRILNLDNHESFVFRETLLGPMLELTDPGHEAAEICHAGDYYHLVTYNEPHLEDGVPYLFLREDLHYRAFQLPDGLPAEGSEIKPVTPVERMYNREELALIGVT